MLTSDGLRILPDQTAAWLPFDDALLTGIAVAPARHELTVSYSVCAPILLSGLPVPWRAVALPFLSPATAVYLEN
ncbi:hypothetical protein [Streptomyces tubercidicus]